MSDAWSGEINVLGEDTYTVKLARSDADTYSVGHKDVHSSLVDYYKAYSSSSSDTNDSQQDVQQTTESDHIYDPDREPAVDTKLPYYTNIGVPFNWWFQVNLNDILGRHRTSLKTEITSLVKEHPNKRKLNFLSNSLHRYISPN